MCFCGADKPFSACCELIIQGKTPAQTAEQLMRSRYSAYASIEPAYLIRTKHTTLLKSQNEADIKAWAKENKWQKLEIISVKNGQADDTTGEVEFKAYFVDYQDTMQVHHEKSSFIKEREEWFYINGIIDPKSITQNRNDYCACGSGKKHKKCCGK